VCYKHGWAVREAGNIEARLAEGAKKWGQVEHICASVPVKDYGLSLEALRKKVRKVLKCRGVLGGTMMFHGSRYRPLDVWKEGVFLCRGWYWSPHFHVLGFIVGGYSKCRNCPRRWNCLKGCGGFYDRTYQQFLKDGYYVKVFGKRKTVFGTAWYQLNHASVKKGVERFHVNTWFGVMSYRNAKIVVEDKKELCPICQHGLIEIRYCGSKHFILDGDDPEYVRESFEDYREGDNVVCWLERKRKGQAVPWTDLEIKSR